MLISIGGMRFSEVSVEVRCAGTAPAICLAPSYEHLRSSIVSTIEGPFSEFARAGFEPPRRLTQDFTAPGEPGTVTISTGRVDVYAVEMMLIGAIFPDRCDVFSNEAAYGDYLDVAYWVEWLLGIALPGNPTVSSEVADGDTVEARQHIRQIEARYTDC
jgi:hypothetical protein